MNIPKKWAIKPYLSSFSITDFAVPVKRLRMRVHFAADCMVSTMAFESAILPYNYPMAISVLHSLQSLHSDNRMFSSITGTWSLLLLGWAIILRLASLSAGAAQRACGERSRTERSLSYSNQAEVAGAPLRWKLAT